MTGVGSDLDLLTRAARTLLGTHWQRPLARLLGVNERTVRNWKSGRSAVPADVLGKVSVQMSLQRELLLGMIYEIEERLIAERMKDDDQV